MFAQAAVRHAVKAFAANCLRWRALAGAAARRATAATSAAAAAVVLGAATWYHADG